MIRLCGLVRFGMVHSWYGLLWYTMVIGNWRGVELQGVVCIAYMVCYGMVWHGMGWYTMQWYTMVIGHTNDPPVMTQ